MMTVLHVMVFAIVLTVAVLAVLFAVVVLAALHGESRLNKDFFMSSTSMWFDRSDYHASAAC